MIWNRLMMMSSWLPLRTDLQYMSSSVKRALLGGRAVRGGCRKKWRRNAVSRAGQRYQEVQVSPDLPHYHSLLGWWNYHQLHVYPQYHQSNLDTPQTSSTVISTVRNRNKWIIHDKINLIVQIVEIVVCVRWPCSEIFILSPYFTSHHHKLSLIHMTRRWRFTTQEAQAALCKSIPHRVVSMLELSIWLCNTLVTQLGLLEMFFATGYQN